MFLSVQGRRFYALCDTSAVSSFIRFDKHEFISDILDLFLHGDKDTMNKERQ